MTYIAKSTAANLFLQLVSAVSAFVLPPLIIVYYGSEINGMIASVKQFISYLTLLEAGIGAGSMVALYRPLARGDTGLRNHILAATRHFYRLSGSLFAIGLLALAILYAWLTRHQLSPELTFWMVLVLGSVNIMDFFLFGTARALLSADQKNHVVATVQAFSVVANIAVAYALIKAGCAILTVQIASSAVQFTKFMILSAYLHRHYPDLRLHYDKKQPYHIAQTWDALIHQLGGLVVFGSPLVLITVFLTLKEASIYAVYMLVFAAVKQALQSGAAGMQSVLGNMLQKSLAQTQQGYAQYERRYLYGLGWIYSCTAILFLPFIGVYTARMHDANYMQPVLALLFLLVGVGDNLRTPAATLIKSAGHFKATRNRSILESVISLTAALALVPFFGLCGILLGSAIALVYRTVDMMIYVHRHILHNKAAPVLWQSAAVSVLIFFQATCGYWLSQRITIQNYPEWIVYAVVVSLPEALLFALMYKRHRHDATHAPH